MLRGVPAKVPPARIDRLWIFAPHQVKSRETGLVLLSLLAEPEGAGEEAGEGGAAPADGDHRQGRGYAPPADGGRGHPEDPSAGNAQPPSAGELKGADAPELEGAPGRAFSGDEPRTVVTLRYRAEMVKGALRLEESLSEEGRAPPDRIEKVVAGVLARSGFEAGEPLLEEIEGSEARWSALLARCVALA